LPDGLAAKDQSAPHGEPAYGMRELNDLP